MRPSQDFTSRNLLWMRSRGGLRFSGDKPTSRADWNLFALDLENQIATGAFRFKGFRSLEISGKKVLSTTDLATVLTLRKINDNIRRAYAIRETQRKHAIQLAKRAIAESVSKGIIRVDLKSCFESISPQKVIDKLRKDALVSHQSLALVEDLFRSIKQHGSRRYSKGIARGLLTSSSFAEIILRSIDREISSLPDVYLLIRYVDDILIFTTRSPERTLPTIEDIVRAESFSLNEAKTDHAISGCICALDCNHNFNSCPCDHGEKCECDDHTGNYRKIEYLGYKLVFKTGKELNDQPVYGLLSDKKVQKLKSRIALAAKDYKSTGDAQLFEDRIAFLTGNLVLGRTERGSRLLSGIAFSHPEYSSCPKGIEDRNKLEHLDNYLRSTIRRTLQVNPSTALSRIWRFSFQTGFSTKRQVKFAPIRMKAIRSCWKHA